MRTRSRFNVLGQITIDGLTIQAGEHSGYLETDRAGKKHFYLNLHYRPEGLPFNEEPPALNVTDQIRSPNALIVIVERE